MFIREVVTGKKTGQPVRYAQIVEAYRDPASGKPRHRVLIPLGRVDRLDTDRIQRLVTALTRYLDTGAVPAGGRLGEVREFGLPYIVDALWSRLGLPAFFARQLRARKFALPVERALFAMVAHRLADPGSKRACAAWLELDAWIPGARGLPLQQLYRAMDFLDEYHEDLERALYQHRRTQFERANMVYFDTTSTYFDGDETSASDETFGLRQYGYSRDLRPDRRQIVVGLATDQNGLPIVSEVFSGDTTDTLTVAPMLARLKDLGLTKVVWVTDRGMASAVNLSAVRAAGLHYIMGARLRAVEDLRAVIASDNAPYVAGPQGLRLKEVHHGERRYIVCFLPQSAARDLAMRAAAIARLEPMLTRVNEGSADACAITQHGWYSRLTTRDADGRFSLDKAKLDREAACDGTFVLEVSDETFPAADAALAYKNLLKVESCFDAIKNTLDIRPVYHRLDRRIRAHVTLCMIALLLDRVIELETGLPFEQVRKLFARLRAAQLVIEETTTWETTTLSPEVRKILTALRLDPPPRVLPNS
jgi:hypothetical protein